LTEKRSRILDPAVSARLHNHVAILPLKERLPCLPSLERLAALAATFVAPSDATPFLGYPEWSLQEHGATRSSVLRNPFAMRSSLNSSAVKDVVAAIFVFT